MAIFLPWFLDGKAQQFWIWAHPATWMVICLVACSLGTLTGWAIRKFRHPCPKCGEPGHKGDGHYVCVWCRISY